MQGIDTTVSLSALRSIKVDDVIDALEKDSCREYQQVFQQEAKSAKEGGADEAYAAWCCLAAITSMYLKPSDPKAPFGPMFVLDDCRGAIPEDLSEEVLLMLSEFYPEIKSAELRARIADVLWLRQRRPKFAHDAVQAYLESARILEDPEHWTHCAKRVERALRLAAMFRRKEPALYSLVSDYIEEVIARYRGEDTLFLSVKFLELLADFKHEDDGSYYQLAVDIAQSAREASNWHKAEQAWEVAEQWANLLSDADKRNDVLTNIAETFVEQAASVDQGLVSSKWLQQAIEVYKKVPNSKERRADLYQDLRVYQQKSLSQMKSFSSPAMDLSESVKLAIKAVKEKSFQDALFHLTFSIVKPPNYEELKEHAKENLQKSLFRGMFGAVHVDRSGLVVAQVPSNFGIENDEGGKAIWAEMLRSVQISHNLDVTGAIEPARREILFEHHLHEQLFLSYLKNNPFVPQGHEYLYAKGLCAGLEGDFVTAAHILIPQFESSARYVLQQKGVEITTLNTHGLQEYIRIGAILDHPVFVEAFGQDITLDLQALLIDRKYVNLRNEVSHGLLSTNLFFQPAVIYFWWLTLRMCLMPLYGLWQNSLDVNESHTNEDHKNGSKYSNLKYC